MNIEDLTNDELIQLLKKRGFSFEELKNHFPPEKTSQGMGELEIYHEQGKIYANNSIGRTILRLTGLPTPIPEIGNNPENMLDIRFESGGTSWNGRE